MSAGWNADILKIADNQFMSGDLMRLCLGEILGEGQFRQVFEWELNKKLVCKFSKDPAHNVIEHQVWENSKDTAYQKWLAPVRYISPSGHFLLMDKIKLLVPEDKKRLPRTVPNFLTDFHPGNYGWLKGQFVCCDYQFLCRALDISGLQKQKLEIRW